MIGRVTIAAEPSFSVHRDHGPAGSVVHLHGSGFGALEKVSLTFRDSANGSTSLGDTKTDWTGAFEAEVVIPADATQGTQQIAAAGQASRLRSMQPYLVT